jgi:hypothetical protein
MGGSNSAQSKLDLVKQSQVDFVVQLFAKVRHWGEPLDWESIIAGTAKLRVLDFDRPGYVTQLIMPDSCTGSLNAPLLSLIGSSLPRLRELDLCADKLDPASLACLFERGVLPPCLEKLSLRRSGWAQDSSTSSSVVIATFAELPRTLLHLDITECNFASHRSGVDDGTGGVHLAGLPPNLRFLFVTGNDQLRLVGDLTAENAWCMSLHGDKCVTERWLPTYDIAISRRQVQGLNSVAVHLGSDAFAARKVDLNRFIDLRRRYRCGNLSADEARDWMLPLR